MKVTVDLNVLLGVVAGDWQLKEGRTAGQTRPVVAGTIGATPSGAGRNRAKDASW